MRHPTDRNENARPFRIGAFAFDRRRVPRRRVQRKPLRARTSWTERVTAGLLLLAIFALAFLYVDHFNARWAANGRHVTQLATRFDAYVPFVPAFVFAYLVYYPWVMLVLPILRQRAQLYRGVAAFVVIEAIAIWAFLTFPSHMERPIVLGAGLAPELVRWVYRVDPGWNLAPSLHVAHCTLVALFYRELAPRQYPWVAAGSCLIAASTVLIKQHYVVDIPFGIACALVAYWATTRAGVYARAYVRARYRAREEALPR